MHHYYHVLYSTYIDINRTSHLFTLAQTTTSRHFINDILNIFWRSFIVGRENICQKEKREYFQLHSVIRRTRKVFHQKLL